MAFSHDRQPKRKANRLRIDHLIKSAQCDELARTVNDRAMADGYRERAMYHRQVAEELPEFESTGPNAEVQSLLTKADELDAKASKVYDRDMQLGYRERAQELRAQAAEIELEK